MPFIPIHATIRRASICSFSCYDPARLLGLAQPSPISAVTFVRQFYSLRNPSPSCGMLAREVSRHKAASTPSQSLSQQLFPSSSPSSPQHAGNGQYSKRPTKQPTITGSISILNPTNSSVLNFSSQPTAQPMVQNKAPHRSIQTSRLADTLDRSDSFHDVPASRPVAKVETETNPLAQLHEAVYFDENDFVDDDELNLDDDDSINNLRPQQKAAEPMSKPPLPPVHNSQAPLHPSRPAAQSKNVITIDDDEPPPPPSSIPIPWSSSPLEHLTAQANKPLSMGNPERGYAGAQPSVSNMMISDRRPKPLARKSSDSDSPWGCKEVSDSVSRPSKRRSGTLEESNSDLLSGRSMPRESSHREALETSSVDAAGRPPKKRTIPWLGTGDQNEHMDGEAEHSMNTSKHQRVPLNKSRDEDLTKTPHMRQKNSDPVYAWEKTASAVKEEQKRLRQTNRKSTLTTKADEEFAPEQDENLQMPKKRGKNVVPAPIFLSDEQQRVLDMVVNKNKSVFYTGSAGKPLGAH
ncbi:hypothetical protein L228DRAFT_17962 [Xylona heveae TC161]|uniref:Uncharacterized protein n=1 Tax=Xylona heveae (strain CBS 132557 / TC161) TaxID=1328760 RepID=A0A165JXE5_XYLHT|nr:hypothetical protein L228DRAFT_17962 [Xylona heveae TC161]KZF26744.1 hypothetical protein L228DRAFT_17962 [Xylona heveae TC161]